jgi:hypothetical protein
MERKRPEEEIIALYSPNLVSLYSINQIARMLGKPYPFVSKKVTGLISRGVLNRTVVGKSHLCSLNFDNPETSILLSQQMLAKRAGNAQAEAVERWLRQNLMRITVHCVVATPTKLVFVLENLRDRREVMRVFPSSEVLDRREFLDMLCDDEEMFGSHTVLYGAERFIELVRIELDELKRLHSPLRY